MRISACRMDTEGALQLERPFEGSLLILTHLARRTRLAGCASDLCAAEQARAYLENEGSVSRVDGAVVVDVSIAIDFIDEAGHQP